MNKQNQLLQILNLNKNDDLMFLLGSGCSISSGCMGSKKLIYEFKKRLYCVDKSIRLSNNQMIDEIRLKDEIEQYFDDSNITNQYSYYFSKCFPDYMDRNSFVKEQFQNKKPSLGYLCFANYLIDKQVKYVLTTNFDNLIELAIHKINETYDYSIVSENQEPILNSSLNIVKIHGDYKYDALKNTEEELKELEPALKEKLLKTSSKKIIVIGYSGQDKSVMAFLNEYFDHNPKTQLIWCGLEEQLQSIDVKNLLAKGRDSYYQPINGFDSLFEDYYKTFGSYNEIIENIANDISNSSFAINISNQPETFKTNSFEITNNPLVFKTSYSEEIKTHLDTIPNLFCLEYKNNLYVIAEPHFGNENLLNNFSLVKLNDEDLPLIIKCKILKEIIKLSAIKYNVKVFRDNLYIENNEPIKCGLRINVDLIDKKICLIVNINYFVVDDESFAKYKIGINRKKSLLYADKNYRLLQKLLDELLPDNRIFTCGKTTLTISKSPIVSLELADMYECRKEPIMIGRNMESANQLKILNSNGPKETLFSLDTIKVGIFCCEDSKPQLKEFVERLVNGDSGCGVSIIPQFKGFEKIFHKKVLFDFDVLPHFYEKQILSKNFHDIIDFYNRGFKIMFDEKQVDIALIYFSDNMASLRNDGAIDFHHAIKLASANKYKTQFLEEKTIASKDNRSKILFNLSTAIYTKTIGMPWYPKKYAKDTLFLGMSFGRDVNGITVGCSQMFDGAGRGMQLIVSRVSDKKKKNQYLSKEEAFELGKKIRQTYYRTSKIEELKRIVIHRSDPFKKEEIEGFKMAFEGINDFDLIQLVEETKFNVYPFCEDVCGSYPIKRGTIIKTQANVAYLWTDGSVNDSDVLPTKTYRNNTKGMSSPLKIVKYFGKISINDASDDLLMLTKMDFNSADVLYSKLPVTIKYSRMVCDMIKQSNFPDELISFEFIM